MLSPCQSYFFAILQPKIFCSEYYIKCCNYLHIVLHSISNHVAVANRSTTVLYIVTYNYEKSKTLLTIIAQIGVIFMAFCIKDKQLFTNGQTLVDNRFLVNYLSDAPSIAMKVYLLGLALANSNGDNNIADIAINLAITEQEVLEAFYYWEEQGLVYLTASVPPQVVYTTGSNSATLKKISPSKYKKFSTEIQRILTGRMITPSEYNEYYMFLENNLFQPEALLAIASYCAELKGSDIKYQYILTVAYNQLRKGASTLTAVADNLATNSKYDSDIALVSKALGTKGKVDHEQREMMDKWAKMGYTLDTIVHVAKDNKGANYAKLDRLILEYYNRGALSTTEISHYIHHKTQLYDTAKLVTKSMGLYYQSLDMIVDEYISKWIARGYEQDTLAMLSKYCFRSNIRTLAGLDNTIDKMYKLGLTTTTSIDNHLSQILASDKQILSVLESVGLDRHVNNADRAQWRTWTTQWNMPLELINYACTKCGGTTAPMQYLNKILSNYKTNNITTVQQAEAISMVSATTTKPTAKSTCHGYSQHEYTDQELSALFTDLDNIEV